MPTEAELRAALAAFTELDRLTPGEQCRVLGFLLAALEAPVVEVVSEGMRWRVDRALGRPGPVISAEYQPRRRAHRVAVDLECPSAS
ncbi:hypothetical protein ACFYZH_32040 [Streptomyces abikoensis]|uniref:hypothetical protein n=1 Tax=Streptomyces abikoensis TaxID=97398 RepID=UPI00369FE5D7